MAVLLRVANLLTLLYIAHLDSFLNAYLQSSQPPLNVVMTPAPPRKTGEEQLPTNNGALK